jgi:ankyrin repeat protein
MQLFIKNGVDINCRDENGNSALINATYSEIDLIDENSKIEPIVEFLLDNGAEVNVVNARGYSPIKNVIIMGDLELLKLLISNGGEYQSLDSDGNSLLFYSKDIEIIEYLVSLGIDINSTTENGQSFIQSFIAFHDVGIKEIEYLITLGADMCYTNNRKSILDYFIESRIYYLFPENHESNIVLIDEIKKSNMYLNLERLYKSHC